MTEADLGLYVHFPFCERKCPYCDFNSHARPFDGALFLRAVLLEIEHRVVFVEDVRPFSTIYFGGGTPSLWDPNDVATLVRFVRERIGLTVDAEITLEANPGTVDARRFEAFAKGGVNRFSIGVQSFVDDELGRLERIHGATEAKEAVRAAQQTGAAVAIDLMYGLLGQTTDALDRSIDTALGLAPQHLSAYALTLAHDAGGLLAASDDDQADMMEHVTTRLSLEGYERYEVSNYARRAHEARHNSLYWVGAPYLGVGPGAHSYMPHLARRNATRRANVNSPERWQTNALLRAFTPAFEETLTHQQVIAERVMLGTRCRFGVDVGALEHGSHMRLGSLQDAMEREVADLVMDGLVRREGTWIGPTPRGLSFSDLLARRLVAALAEGWTYVASVSDGNSP